MQRISPIVIRRLAKEFTDRNISVETTIILSDILGSYMEEIVKTADLIAKRKGMKTIKPEDLYTAEVQVLVDRYWRKA